MNLTEGRAEVLATVAKNPGYDVGQIAGSLDRSKSSVSSILSDLREHGLVVKAQGNGAVRYVGVTKAEEDVEVENEEQGLQWLVTGDAKQMLLDKWHEYREIAKFFEESYLYAHEYRPAHVLQEGGGRDE